MCASGHYAGLKRAANRLGGKGKSATPLCKMTDSVWANWAISLSIPVVLLARRTSVVQFRDHPLGAARRRRRRRDVLRAGT